MDDPVGGRFKTFEGVLRSTLLTILGAMFYLREGWLVGSLGLGGALAVIGAAHLVTGTTALSVSSVATNVRVRAGGAFAIIAQALGLEAGGAIGIPLYIAQSLSAAMYLYAFSEGWAYLFPQHPTGIVVSVAFGGVCLLTLVSAGLAFRAQAALLFVVGLAVASAFGGLLVHPLHTPTLGPRPDGPVFREAFALFFPAATGIMVGVGMSGSLANPRRSVPRGTLGAWGIGLGVYASGALFYALIAPPDVLVSNNLVMVEGALWGPLVLVGLVCSTLMAALSSLVAAPRLLQAMSATGVIPGGGWLGKLSGGEPRRAALLTFVVAGLGLLTGSLDAIAPIITAFFLVTYLAINLVVAVEQRLEMVSFRPTFAIPRWVPVVGVVASALGLGLASPAGGLLELAMVAGLYVWLSRRELATPWDTVRSGAVAAAAAWVARRTMHLPPSRRAWKPDLLVPVTSAGEAAELGPLLRALTRRQGTLKLVGVAPDTGAGDRLYDDLGPLVGALRSDGHYTAWTTLSASDYSTGLRLALDAARADYFPANLVLVDADRYRESQLQGVVDACAARRLGLALLLPHPLGGLGPGRSVSVWISPHLAVTGLDLRMVNVDMPVLMAWLLAGARSAPLALCSAVASAEEVPAMEAMLQRLVDGGRLPGDTRTHVVVGGFIQAIKRAAPADVHLFGLAPEVDIDHLDEVRGAAGGHCLFLRDSGQESFLA